MKAIQTKYLGPTNFRGSRIVATAEGGHRLVIPYDYGANDHGHSEAAIQLARKIGWTGEMVSGGLPDGSTCWVFTTGGARIDIAAGREV